MLRPTNRCSRVYRRPDSSWNRARRRSKFWSSIRCRRLRLRTRAATSPPPCCRPPSWYAYPPSGGTTRWTARRETNYHRTVSAFLTLFLAKGVRPIHRRSSAFIGGHPLFFAACEGVLNWKRLFSRRPGALLTPELRARIQTSFDEAAADEEHFPSTIDPRIYHVKLIQQ